MIDEVVCYTVRCDECGKSADEGSEYSGWGSTSFAIESAENAGWSLYPSPTEAEKVRCTDHNPFCDKCGEDAGEFYGERDYMCYLCFLKDRLMEEVK